MAIAETVYNEIQELPSREQAEILDFIHFLKFRKMSSVKTSIKPVPASKHVVRPRFGSAKGLVKISPDFDKPLTDFKEYMK